MNHNRLIADLFVDLPIHCLWTWFAFNLINGSVQTRLKWTFKNKVSALEIGCVLFVLHHSINSSYSSNNILSKIDYVLW